MDDTSPIPVTPYTLNREQSFRELASGLTIGGAAYGPALATFNGYSDADARLPAGSTINIPEPWMGLPPASAGTVTLAGLPWYVWAIGLAVLVAAA